MCWVAGFDTIYAVQDIEFDRRANLYSIPSLFGIKTSLRFAAAFHFAAVIFFLLAGSIANLKSPFYILLMITCGLLSWEHRLLRPGDLSRLNVAFFNVNSMVSFSVLVAVWFGIR